MYAVTSVSSVRRPNHQVPLQLFKFAIGPSVITDDRVIVCERQWQLNLEVARGGPSFVDNLGSVSRS